MDPFSERNRDNFLVGTVASAGEESFGLLLCLKDCCFTSGPDIVGECCGVAHVHLQPGTALPNVGDRIGCFGRLVNASKVGALIREATWKHLADLHPYEENAIENNGSKRIDKLRQSELALAHLQAAAGILNGLSCTRCEDETLLKSLEGLRMSAQGLGIWSKELPGTEYEAVTYEQAFVYLFRCLAGVAEVADRLISEKRTPDQIVSVTQIIAIRNRVESALLTMADMNEKRLLARRKARSLTEAA